MSLWAVSMLSGGHVLCWDSYVMTNISVTEWSWRSGGIVKAGKIATSHLRVTFSVSSPVLWRWDLSLQRPTLQEETGFNGGGGSALQQAP